MLYFLMNMTDIGGENMDSRKIALRETGTIAIGVAIGTVIIVGIFALWGRFSLSVLLGGIAGALFSILYFFSTAIVSTLAADKAEQQDVDGGKKLLKSSCIIRMPVLAALLILFAKSGYFNVIALMLPLAFVRPTITIAEFFRWEGE